MKKHFHWIGFLGGKTSFYSLSFSLRSQKWKKEWASSHTPRSNIAWECWIQWMAIPSISDGLSDKNPVSSELHTILLPKFKRDINCSLKDQIIESKFPVDMHIYTLCPSLLQSFRKFCWAVSEELRWQTVLSSIFNFCQIFKLKKGIIPRKKMESKFPVDKRIYILCNYKVSGNSVERFQRSCANILCWVVSFILAKFLSSKRA